MLVNKEYLFPSEPEIEEVDEKKVALAAAHLKEVLEKGGGITEEEEQELLKWSVSKAREGMANEGIDITHNYLGGYYGYSQALTMLPFANIRAIITLNNVYYFPFAKTWHAYGTVLLPIIRDNTGTQERFLIDATYRQWFSIINNNDGFYYNIDRRFKNKVGPEAGYYTAQYPGGKGFASTLLRKGYIKLGPGLIKMYGIGFVANNLNITNRQNLAEIFELKEEEFMESVLKSESNFDYDSEEIEEISKIVNFPSLNLQK